MAAVPSIESLVLNFQRIASLSGKEEPATPVCKGLPRKMGQSVAGTVFSARGDGGFILVRIPSPNALMKINIAKQHKTKIVDP